MKNIHLIPTDKARLYLHQGKLYDHKTTMHIADGTQIPQNIHITSNEEIKDGDWIKWGEAIYKANKKYMPPFKKIILTTDQDLIKDGVQAIDDEFLEWFINNPSCEEVEIERDSREVGGHNGGVQIEYGLYEILIPKEKQKQHLIDMMRYDEELGLYEEPKQETLEEAIKREYEARKFDSDFPFDPQSFKAGAKWQAKRRYSEEEVLVILYEQLESLDYYGEDFSFSLFWEQFKKK